MAYLPEEEEEPKKKKKKQLSGTVRMRRRSYVAMGALLVFCGAVIGQLFKISIIDNEMYEELANNYHFGTMTLDASRGSIYDANGTVLAWSATVYNVYIDPELYREEMESIEEDNADKEETASENGETADNLVDIDQLHESIVTFLSETLDVDEDEIEESFTLDTQYHVLQTQVEEDVADEVLEFFDDLGLSFIGTESSTKRYYPQNELAASVIGFTNADGDGQYGLEYEYDEYLSGVDGRVISAQAADGEEMPYRYSTTYDAEDGASLYLTLDVTMQYYLEEALAEMVEDYDVQDRACGIIMNAKTGEIYAMATYPSFDLNDPSTIYDTSVAEELAEITDEDEYEEAYEEAREEQWTNKTISEINPAGSTFKIVTTASALEEDLIDLESDSFYCSGSYTILDATIGCSNTYGHGTQTFTEALTNSCNPAFIEIGQRLGIEKFSYYFRCFGLTETTGVDLPNEISGSYIEEDDMTLVDLASSSIGQTNELTALGLITAYAAAINGGYLVTPYIVDKVVDSNGNVVLENETTIKRQVISEETSETLREQLQAVVESNPSHNAYIQGYEIGGKSGTAEILTTSDVEDDYVSSYCCFAPADDPEIILLMQADYPNPEIGYYGSTVVVPYAREVMENVLPYLGYYPEYDDEEYEDADVSVPLVQDATVESAEATLTELGLTYEVVGEGTSVVAQSPTTGTTVSSGGKVILYTEEEITDLVQVPDLTDMTLESVITTLDYYDLNYVAIGATDESSTATVLDQSETAGTYVQRGTCITITLVEGEAND